jgi:hypothetical protein
MQRLTLTAVVVALLGLVGSARTDDKAKADGKDVTGTWTWSVTFNDRTIDFTLKLKQEGDKVTGTLSTARGDTKIEDGKCKDGEVCFKVTRERDGQKFTSTYKGKVAGNTIKGNVEFGSGDRTQKRDWEAKRKAD